MAIKKLNDEELDMVTGGSIHETAGLNEYLGRHLKSYDGNLKNWLKANLNIDCKLNDCEANEYSFTENGVTRTLSHEKVKLLIIAYSQHPNG